MAFPEVGEAAQSVMGLTAWDLVVAPNT